MKQTDQHRKHDIPLKLIHTATPDMTKLSSLCRVRFGGVNWITDNSRLSPTENLKSEHVNSNCLQIHTSTPDDTNWTETVFRKKLETVKPYALVDSTSKLTFPART